MQRALTLYNANTNDEPFNVDNADIKFIYKQRNGIVAEFAYIRRKKRGALVGVAEATGGCTFGGNGKGLFPFTLRVTYVPPMVSYASSSSSKI